MNTKPVSELAIEILKRNVGSTFTPGEIARILRRSEGARHAKEETVRRHLDRLTQDGLVPLIWGASVYLERVSPQCYRAVKASDVPIGKCTDTMLLNELGLRMNAARV